MARQRSSSQCSSNASSSVFIRNLDKEMDEETLSNICSVFGRIRRCEVNHHKKASSITFGFVHYDSEDSASACIQALNGMLLMDRKITVDRAIDPEKRSKDDLLRNLYVKNFGNELTNESLKELFDKFGPISNSGVVKDKNGQSCGHGFVVFRNTASAAQAIRELNGWKLSSGKQLQVGCAAKITEAFPTEVPGQEGMSFRRGLNLYVNNLERWIDDKGLRKMFEPFGTVISARIIQGNNNFSKGYGFVCLSTVEQAVSAILNMNGQKVATKTLHVSFAQCKKDREPLAQCVQQVARMAVQPTPANQMYRPLGYGSFSMPLQPAGQVNMWANAVPLGLLDDGKPNQPTGKSSTKKKDPKEQAGIVPGNPGTAAT
ncbi:polyadenylate-binding protein 1-like [Topomyia yanbarensis]|uniref:polyadenylate-binding protein 1-like n=1 Tax=Topomyia yanbarensis TaxID=2498891 RepID=UPI00273AB3AD|nr:polyadenylate-binding protein 1-like [Topomyia yanbarensis]